MTVPTAIIGLGYVGLPLAKAALDGGHTVTGFDINHEVFDINDEVVAGLNAGRSHIDDLHDADVKEMLRRGSVRPPISTGFVMHGSSSYACQRHCQRTEVPILDRSKRLSGQ